MFLKRSRVSRGTASDRSVVICRVQMIVVLHTAFEYLARIAVFIEQARIGENLAINENVSFEDEFTQLEDDHEAGLYWLEVR